MRSERPAFETKILDLQTGGGRWTTGPGRPVSLTCPECSGPVAELRDRTGVRYRCQVGHGYSLQAILVARLQDTERSLWHLASNSMETASLSELLARQSRRDGLPALAEKFRRIARACHTQLALFQKMVLSLPDGNIATETRRRKARK